MSVIGSNILAGASGQGGEYTIEESLRFNASQSSYLSRTNATTSNTKTWTFSAWVKKASVGTAFQQIFYSGDASAGNDQTGIYFRNADQLAIIGYVGGGLVFGLTTNALFRDPSAWYHILYAVDTTQATAENRIKLYVNGVQQTFTGTNYPALNQATYINSSTYPTLIGKIAYNTTSNFDGYLTEVNFIDGQALDPSSFGEFDATTGVWKPKEYTGTYGTNGFYLNFSDASTTTTLGYDYSGQSNNWLLNNFSLTGTAYCSMTDTPTPYLGGGNYAVLNPLGAQDTNITYSEANLKATSASASGVRIISTIAPSSGKYYFEVNKLNTLTAEWFGLRDTLVGDSSLRAYNADGTYFNGSSWSAYGATFTTGDVIGVAFDLDADEVTFYKNGVSQGTKTSIGLSGLDVTPTFLTYSTGSFTVNFGQRPFAYTPPTGFKALHTGNLPDSSIVDGSKHFDALLYTGNGSTQSVTGLEFQPDLVWLKSRSTANSNALYDAVRGQGVNGYYGLSSNTTNADIDGTNLSSLDATGFTLGSNTGTNGSGATFVGWNWKANGTGVSNTDGSITSTVSANPTAGFSIVSYTGTGANATVGHGLGVAPSMVITKQRSATGLWAVYHASVGATGYLALNTTAAFATLSTTWNNTAPTSSVVHLGAAGATNDTTPMVMYAFAEVEGYSKFGSYTGNGSADGPFVYTGFRPRYILVKRSSTGAGTANWIVIDTARDTYNLAGQSLEPNLADAEYTPASSGYPVDILSNGFKQRGASVSQNESGSTYIYMAFAENPFKNSLAR